MKNNKTRHICDLTFCRHINTENICTIGNQENCVYYRTLQALNGYKENAKWCDDCKKIKELEQKNHAMLVNSLKICNQSEIDNDENERKIAELEEKLANADYQLEGRDLKIKEFEAQIEKMKCDVKANIKWADTNKNNQMYCKLNAMINQWEIKEND